jgi:hypothetical protein
MGKKQCMKKRKKKLFLSLSCFWSLSVRSSEDIFGFFVIFRVRVFGRRKSVQGNTTIPPFFLSHSAQGTFAVVSTSSLSSSLSSSSF